MPPIKLGTKSLWLAEPVMLKEKDPIERAEEIQRLCRDLDCTMTEASRRLGISPQDGRNTVALLRLPAAIKTALRNEIIRKNHAVGLCGMFRPKENEAPMIGLIAELTKGFTKTLEIGQAELVRLARERLNERGQKRRPRRAAAKRATALVRS